MKVKYTNCIDIHHTRERRWATKGIGLTVSRCPKCDYPGLIQIKK